MPRTTRPGHLLFPAFYKIFIRVTIACRLSKGGVLDIEVNNQVGKLTSDALHARLAAAGHHFPKLPVCPLWEALETIGRLAESCRNPEALERLIKKTPRGSYTWVLVTTMALAASLEPHDAHLITGASNSWEKELAQYGCKPFAPVEHEALGEALRALVAVPRDPNVMGTRGTTLFHNTKLNLKPVFGDAATRRRQGFLAEASRACHRIEQENNRADRRADASKLAQALSEELRLSGYTQKSQSLDRFWIIFEFIDIGAD